ncbi:hypothetical protein CIRG_05434 [Coccidioides immitis RMSCC 2394]|uniref:Uncharacterized protein n=2 Tax=Coccidioides TaxID=5500 RepID=A0A0J6YFM9_COCIT|nr:hypothetical protein CPAG_07352 [Coccidioides posadasii RMSCC 3488]KMP05753.1 hypothetical protein CIRG_05434 [Coccidioides immitis RMSCC 2394]
MALVPRRLVSSSNRLHQQDFVLASLCQTQYGVNVGTFALLPGTENVLPSQAVNYLLRTSYFTIMSERPIANVTAGAIYPIQLPYAYIA